MLRYFIVLLLSLSLSACVDRTVSEIVPSAMVDSRNCFLQVLPLSRLNGHFDFDWKIQSLRSRQLDRTHTVRLMGWREVIRQVAEGFTL